MKNLFMIGILGDGESGRGRLATCLVEEFRVMARTKDGHYLRAFRESLSRPVREFVRDLFSFTEEEMARKNEPVSRWGLSPKKAMQTLSNEWGRSLHPEIWTKALLGRVERLTENPGKFLVVVDDVRFVDEIKALHQATPHFLLIRLSEEGSKESCKTEKTPLRILGDISVYNHPKVAEDVKTTHLVAQQILQQHVQPWLP